MSIPIFFFFNHCELPLFAGKKTYIKYCINITGGKWGKAVWHFICCGNVICKISGVKKFHSLIHHTFINVSITFLHSFFTKRCLLFLHVLLEINKPPLSLRFSLWRKEVRLMSALTWLAKDQGCLVRAQSQVSQWLCPSDWHISVTQRVVLLFPWHNAWIKIKVGKFLSSQKCVRIKKTENIN